MSKTSEPLIRRDKAISLHTCCHSNKINPCTD